MAVPTVDAVATNNSNSATSLDVSITFTSAADRVALAWAELVDGGDADYSVSSVVLDPGGANEANFTNEQTAAATGANYARVECWRLINPPAGTFTVRFTFSETVARCIVAVEQLSGADQTDPVGASANASGTTITPSVDVTTTVADSRVCAGIMYEGGVTFTPGTNVTERWDVTQTGHEGWGGDKAAGATGTYTVDATVDGSAGPLWLMLGVEVKPAAGGATHNLIAAATGVSVVDDATVLALIDFARPLADSHAGAWTPTPLYAQIDEATPSDVDYIESEGAPANSPAVVQLSSEGDPGTDTDHVLRYRYQKTAAGGQIDLTVELREAYVSEASPGTLIASWSHVNIGETITAAEQALTTLQAGAITDYADLHLRFVANAV